jgi:hypothetical protein
MRADRLAELAMNKPEDEIHKRIERLRATIEAPPLKTFTQKAQSAVQPPSAPAVEQPKAADVPRKAEPPPAPAAHDVEIPLSEAVETVSQPVPEILITSLLMPSTKFVPSAFQSALYRIDVSLKHSLLTLTETATDKPDGPEAPLAATIGVAGALRPGRPTSSFSTGIRSRTCSRVPPPSSWSCNPGTGPWPRHRTWIRNLRR